MQPAVTRARSRLIPLLATGLALALVAGCAADQGVSTIAAEQAPPGLPALETADPPDAPDAEAPDDTATPTAPPTAPPSTDQTADEPTEPSLPAISEPQLLVDIPIGDVVVIDSNKPARDYDPFVAVALTDIERWWSEHYPAIYGDDFEPLRNGIYAGYPERQDDIPGCGESSTSYQDLNLFVAFYCQLSDFMAYDDGEDSLLAPLAESFGPAVMGIVLAHEYGHAIQSRIGALEQSLATIYTEQQADCFSGAWTGQAYRGESPLLRLGDADVRAGLIAMLEVRDPVGTDQFVTGGHGSAFDRVGAFQEGFRNGPERCAQLLDEPLTLMPNRFQPFSADELLQGNAPYFCEDLRGLPGFSEEDIANCSPAPEFLADDLNDFWITTLGAEFPNLNETAAQDVDAFGCSDGVRLANELLLCPSQNAVVYDEPEVVDLYRNFGDFTLGYFYGIAWAERAQEVEGNQLQGEARALLNDCYTGAWVRDITPGQDGTTRRAGDRDGDGQDDTVVSSPGDLDEAIRMAILYGDAGANVDAFGSPFEKIESFRAGVLGGLEACRARFQV